MSIAALPHRYEVSLASRGNGDALLTSGPLPPIPGGPPAQFGGDGKVWSPEELLLASLTLCLMTTFDSLADRDHLPVAAFQCHTAATLDRTPSGPRFTQIVQTVTILIDDQPAAIRALKLLDQAKRRCIIANTLNAPIELIPTIQTLSEPDLTTEAG
jgi:organic hydroperoxide reductase OsmC/OhrA